MRTVKKECCPAVRGIFGDYFSFTFRIFYAERYEKSRYFLKRYKFNISHTLWESGQTLTTSAGKIPVITLNSVFFVSADSMLPTPRGKKVSFVCLCVCVFVCVVVCVFVCGYIF